MTQWEQFMVAGGAILFVLAYLAIREFLRHRFK